MKKEIKHYKVKNILEATIPNSVFYVKSDNSSEVSVYITTLSGEPIPIKDLQGSGGISIISSDNSISISGTSTKDLKLSSTLYNLIQSSLQSGDTISSLINDSGYITLADIPAFDPTNYDLSEFTNTSFDPFVKESQLTNGNTNLEYTPSPTQGIVTSDTGTDATIPLASGTNAGLFSPTEKTKLTGIESGAEVNNISDTDVIDLTDGGNTTLHHHDSRYYTETEVDTYLSNKVDKVTGKQLSTEDYTTTEKNKLAAITGTNTGDETTSSIQTKRPLKTINGDSIEGTGDLQIDYNELSNLPSIPSITNLVPYTGATQDVDLDTNSLNAKSLHIKGAGGDGHLGLKHQSINSAANPNETSLFAGNDGELYYKNDGNSVVKIASREWVTALGYITNVITSLGYTPENSANKQSDLTPSTTKYPTVNAVITGLNSKIDANVAITGATKTKITFDSKGLITSATDATTADISDSTNKRYITDSQQTVLSNTSGVNTGDETSNSLQTKGTNFVLISDGLAGTPVTGGTSFAKSLIKSYLIPANTFASGDIFEIWAIGSKVNTNTAWYIELSCNTTNTLTGSTQLGRTFSANSTTIYLPFQRIINFTSSNQIKLIATSGANFISEASTTVAQSTISFDSTVNNYLFFSVVPVTGATADIMNIEKVLIIKSKYKATI